MDVVIGWQDFECVFQGGPAKMQIRPLKRGHALKVLPFLDKATDGAASGVKLMADTFELQELMGWIFDEHVRNMDLTVNGAAVDGAVMAEEAVLAPLAASIMAELVRISFFTKRDEKNSGGPSVA